MCLVIDRSFTPPAEGEETFYKVVMLSTNGKLYSPYIEGFEYWPGVVKADRTYVHIDHVYNSIHVFLKKDAAEARARELAYYGCYNVPKILVLKVTANYKHLTGMNWFEAAFSQICLSQEEYDKAIKTLIWRMAAC